MTKGFVGSMSTMGFITAPQIKAAKKIDYWFSARRNQNTVIREIESFQYVKETCQGTNATVDDFCEKLRNSLNNVLLECFELVDIKVESEPVSTNGSMFRAKFSGIVTENGIKYDLAKAVIFNNNTFEKIDEGRNARI